MAKTGTNNATGDTNAPTEKNFPAREPKGKAKKMPLKPKKNK